MKKLVLALAMTLLAGSAWADGYHRHRHHHHHNYRWVAPAIVGGTIVYSLSQPRYYSAPPPVTYYVPQPNYYYAPPAYPGVPYGYREELRYDAYCNCDRLVLVPN